MIVYKYLRPSRIDVLEQSRIRFTQPAALNDPFETFPCFLEYGPWLLQNVHQQAVETFGVEDADQSHSQRQSQVVQKLLDLPYILSKYFVILSLSQIRDNLLMWSHYADSHRGFVIGFDASSRFFAPGAGKARDGLRAVSYSDTRYVIPKGGYGSVNEPSLQVGSDGVFFTKGSYWSYEREMRILAHPKSAAAVLPSPDGHDIHLFDFPPESVKEVIFGFRMSDADQHRTFDLVQAKYPLANVGKAFPHESRFEIYVKMFSG